RGCRGSRAMNGIHDMGGMHGMGPLEREAGEPVFHHPWEGRVYAMTRVTRTRNGPWCLDAHRHTIERIPPDDYLRMTYYERWLNVLTRLLLDTGSATQAEIDAGQAAAGGARSTPNVTAATVASIVDLRPTARRDVAATAHFKAGQRVRA